MPFTHVDRVMQEGMGVCMYTRGAGEEDSGRVHGLGLTGPWLGSTGIRQGCPGGGGGGVSKTTKPITLPKRVGV
jgi:hypothetical protein